MQNTNIVAKFAKTYDLDPNEVGKQLKATAFRQKSGGPAISDEQMVALIIVSEQHKLNPWLKEIYAFPGRDGQGIIPVVGVDGWARIINSHPQFDGMDFDYSEEEVELPGMSHGAPAWCECTIHRKDRSHPIRVREYLDEVYRESKYKGPWQTHTRRFLRHKAMIQAARLAFSFAGIYDSDEAERIIQAETEEDMRAAMEIEGAPEIEVALPVYPQDSFEENLPKWRMAISSGRRAADDIIERVRTRYQLTDEQVDAIKHIEEAA